MISGAAASLKGAVGAGCALISELRSDAVPGSRDGGFKRRGADTDEAAWPEVRVRLRDIGCSVRPLWPLHRCLPSAHAQAAAHRPDRRGPSRRPQTQFSAER